MNVMLRGIGSICEEHLFEEKILLVPSYSIGHRLLQVLSEEGYRLLNLRVEILSGIAEKICTPYLHRKNLTLIPGSLAHSLMHDILLQLKENGELKYFREIEITPSFSKNVYGTINELKLAGFEPSRVVENGFVNPEKGRDIKKILTEYERVLKENGLVDLPVLYRLALKQPVGSDSLYIIPANLRLQSLEREFLEKLTAGRRHIVFPLSPCGLESPADYFAIPGKDDAVEVSSDKDRLRWLYGGEDPLKPFYDGSVDMFHAYGETSEVKEVIRRIKSEGIPLDRVAVFYTSQEPYTQFFFDLSRSLDLPVTFGQGISIKNTRPGKLLFSLIEWIGSDYEVQIFYRILTGGDLKPEEEDSLSPYRAARLLRNAGIGWSRERYSICLEREAEDHRHKSGESYREIVRVKEFMERIFSFLPVPGEEGEVKFAELLCGLVQLVEKYGSITCDMDAEARDLISGELKIIAENATNFLSLQEALDRIEDMAGGLRVAVSPPRPGALHLDHYVRGIWVYRPHTFIIGLDAGRFPGEPTEDAVLLDTERSSLGKGLKLRRRQAKENLYEMAQLLCSLPERVILSFSSYDTCENREQFPSPLLLQVYRLLSGSMRKDYSDLIKALKNRKGFMPADKKDVLDENEWWLYQGLLGKLRTTVPDYFPNLGRGLLALRQRNSPQFTEFDGNVAVEPEEMDPRKNTDLILASSQLEKLGTCPFGYFLRYILGIEPPRDVKYDRERWLDHLARGNLLHNIFERFYTGLVKMGEEPQLVKHKKMLYEIADEAIEEQKELIPPPSTVVYEREYDELLESCRVFLACEEEYCRSVSPRFFELSFGVNEENPELGKLPAAVIELPAGERFRLRGRIDRVDQCGEATFRVIDYKTGSPYNYRKREFFKGGRQLQHTLYALALEGIFEGKGICSNPRVIEAGYFFPTVKGEGQRIMRSQEKREDFYRVIESLCDLLSQGVFIMTDCDDDCKFCDYGVICERESLKEALKEKHAAPETEPLRRVRCYE